MQLVLEFGSNHLDRVIDVIRGIFRDLPHVTECRSKDADVFELCNESLESVGQKLSAGEISGFILRPRTETSIRYALVLSPFADDPKRSFVLGTIEYTDEKYVSAWNLILETSDIIVASVGFEEGVELHDSNIMPDTFPWFQSPLVIGAVRSSSDRQEWIIREGPESRWLSGSSG